MVQENIHGLMEDPMLEVEKTIKCTEKVYLNGLMEGDMKVNTLKIRNKDMDSLNGQMAVNIMANGWVNSVFII